MKYFIIVYIFISIDAFQVAKCQTNLVKNGSFEDTISCPVLLGDIEKSRFWTSPTLGTPDYFNVCNIGPLSVPHNGFGWSEAEEGHAYAGIITFNSGNGREYIQGELSDTLISGVRYIVSFYATPSNLQHCCNNSLGAYLSIIPVGDTNSSHVLNYDPQIKNDNFNPLNDTSSWKIISDTLIANGGENHITIGNFLPDSLSDTSNVTFPTLYYFIDNVSIVKDTTTGISKLNDEENLFLIYPNPFQDEITIHSNHSVFGKLMIRDKLGKILLKEKFTSNKTVNLSFLSAGIYFITIESDKKIYKQKIVKLH